MPDKNEINYKDFYENDGKRLNIWKANRRSLLFLREYARYKRIAQLLGRPSLDVLDLGCGDGYLSCILAEKGHKVDAMDISAERLKKFENHAGKLGIRQINASVYDYIFDKRYDAVIISEVIEHLENYEQIVSKVFDFLKPGGRIIIAVPYRETISYCKCPYCLKEFNIYGHLHSFDEHTLEPLIQKLGGSIGETFTFNNRFSGYFIRISPVKGYALYRAAEGLFGTFSRKNNTHMVVELIKK